ncbi:unnamed protein product [Citrullus colocynthis]|uniref:Uncharacterized protein n=1 Tax=Citrullus colocynthis TaxID=252529 RepID=A0ABP0YU88_9ROSI
MVTPLSAQNNSATSSESTPAIQRYQVSSDTLSSKRKNHGTSQPSRNNNQNRENNKERGRNHYSPYLSPNKLTCQICGKYGHVADVYYSCYHKNEETSTNATDNQKNNSLTALMAYLKIFEDPVWYLDSGATNHVTTDL